MHLLYMIDILEAKPNKMFTEQQRALVRFVRSYGQSMTCAHCGKKKRTLWTMLTPFRAVDLSGIVAVKGEELLAPLTLVCTEHLMQPEFVKSARKRNQGASR